MSQKDANTSTVFQEMLQSKRQLVSATYRDEYDSQKKFNEQEMILKMKQAELKKQEVEINKEMQRLNRNQSNIIKQQKQQEECEYLQSIGDFRKKMKEVEDDRKKEDRKRKREQSLEDA